MRRALTLVEAVISIVLVGVTLVAALQTVGAAVRTRSMTGDQATAELLASELLAEVIPLAYADPQGGSGLGEDPGETDRTNFDDVDDYDNWLEYPPETRSGSARTELSGWARRVEVDYVSPNPGIGAFNDMGYKRVIVRVWRDGYLLTELVALRTAAMPGWTELP